MNKGATALWLTTLMSLAGAISLAGCTDVGDSSSGEGTSDAGSSLDATNPVDAQTSDDATADDSTSEAAAATGAEAESDDGASPGEPEDSGATQPPPPEDSGAPEGEEAGGPDASPEAGTSGPDSSVADTGAPDAGPADSGTQEGGALDSGVADAGTVDAGHDAGLIEDSGVADAGGVDAGSTGGHDAGALVPCTTPNQTGCVQCVGSLNSPTCTATEALIVETDIARGNVTSAGQLKPNTATEQGSCYTCLNAKACLDDDEMDTGLECADAVDLAGTAAGSGVTQCLATLACILTSDCQGPGGIAGTSAVASQESLQLCYCGGNNPGSVCSTAGSATNGLCVTQEAAGFGFPYTDNKDILANYELATYPSGVANLILACGASNHCTICE
jgi:hypothetical protein